jgi:hypothetical protein
MVKTERTQLTKGAKFILNSETNSTWWIMEVRAPQVEDVSRRFPVSVPDLPGASRVQRLLFSDHQDWPTAPSARLPRAWISVDEARRIVALEWTRKECQHSATSANGKPCHKRENHI